MRGVRFPRGRVWILRFLFFFEPLAPHAMQLSVSLCVSLFFFLLRLVVYVIILCRVLLLRFLSLHAMQLLVVFFARVFLLLLLLLFLGHAVVHFIILCE